MWRWGCGTLQPSERILVPVFTSPPRLPRHAEPEKAQQLGLRLCCLLVHPVLVFNSIIQLMTGALRHNTLDAHGCFCARWHVIGQSLRVRGLQGSTLLYNNGCRASAREDSYSMSPVNIEHLQDGIGRHGHHRK